MVYAATPKGWLWDRRHGGLAATDTAACATHSRGSLRTPVLRRPLQAGYAGTEKV